jgi:hypothetical protein
VRSHCHARACSRLSGSWPYRSCDVRFCKTNQTDERLAANGLLRKQAQTAFEAFRNLAAGSASNRHEHWVCAKRAEAPGNGRYLWFQLPKLAASPGSPSVQHGRGAGSTSREQARQVAEGRVRAASVEAFASTVSTRRCLAPGRFRAAVWYQDERVRHRTERRASLLRHERGRAGARARVL